MKKSLSALLAVSLLAGLFISCDNLNNISQEEPDPYTNGNRPSTKSSPDELTTNQVIELTIDQEVDLSSYAGKKAFLVVTNNSSQTKSPFLASSSVNTINEENANYNNSTFKQRQIINIPFEDKRINYPLIQGKPVSARSLNASSTETTYTLGQTKTFYGYGEDDKLHPYGEDSVLKAVGTHCYVWYKKKSGISVTDTQLQKLADTFDSIYEKETYIFGDNYDPNCNYSNLITCNTEQKVHLIVYDIYDDYSASQTGGVFGYFTSYDFNKNGVSIEQSNECECLHLDSYFLQIAEGSMLSTIAHEFQHLLHFVNKGLKYSTSNNTSIRYSDTWFNEMMSMVCEDIMQTQLDLEDDDSPKGRLNTFNSNYILGFEKWREGNDVYVSYANAYAFGAYLVRNFGIDFIKELAQNDYVNKEAITQALISTGASVQSFDEAFENYYNVVLNPEGTYYTLNREATQTYTIDGSQVTFKCTKINLNDYLAINGHYLNSESAKAYYKAQAFGNYYGPIILNAQYYYLSLDPYGMFVSYWGEVGSEAIPTNYTLSSSMTGLNTGVKYRLVITD